MGYLLDPVPPPVGHAGLHPPGQRQQLVVPLPPLLLLRLLLPLLLRLLRVRLLLPLQPAPLPRLAAPLRLAPGLLLLFILLSAGAGGRGAVIAPQEGALPAAHRAAVVAGAPAGLAPVPVRLLAVLLRGALEVRLGPGGGGGERAFIAVVQDGGGKADLALLGGGHLGLPHGGEHFPLVEALHVRCCCWSSATKTNQK